MANDEFIKRNNKKNTSSKDEIKIPGLDNYKSPTFSVTTPMNKDSDSRRTSKLLKPITGQALKHGTFQAASSLGKRIANEMPYAKEAVEDAFSLAGDLGAIKNEIFTSARDFAESAKKASRYTLPTLEKVLPRSWFSKLDKYTEQPVAYRGKTKEELRGEESSRLLADVFKEQAIFQRDIVLDEKSDKAVELALKNRQHKDLSILVDQGRKELAFQSNFLSTTFTAYLKKSLELKYSQNMYTQDILGTLQTMVSVVESKLEDIKLNTSLPDIQKQYWGESIKQELRGRISGGIGDYAAGFKDNIVKNVRENFSDQITSIFDTMTQGLDMYSDMEEFQKEFSDGDEFGDDFGESFKQMASDNTAGGVFGKYIGKLLGAAGASRVGKHIFKKHGDKIKTVDSFFKNYQMKLGLSAKDWRNEDFIDNFTRDDAGKESLSFKNLFQNTLTGGKRLLASQIPDISTEHTVGNQLVGAGSSGPTHFDLRTKQSVIEVIPGYLAKILQSVSSLVMGKHVDELVYDSNKRDFVTSTIYKGDIKTRLMDDIGSSASTTDVGVSNISTRVARSTGNVTKFDLNKEDFKVFINAMATEKIQFDRRYIALLSEFITSGLDTPDNDHLKATLKSIDDPKAFASFLVGLVKSNKDKSYFNSLIIDINNVIIDVMKIIYGNSFLQNINELFRVGHGRYISDIVSYDGVSGFNADKRKVSAWKTGDRSITKDPALQSRLFDPASNINSYRHVINEPGFDSARLEREAKAAGFEKPVKDSTSVLGNNNVGSNVLKESLFSFESLYDTRSSEQNSTLHSILEAVLAIGTSGPGEASGRFVSTLDYLKGKTRATGSSLIKMGKFGFNVATAPIKYLLKGAAFTTKKLFDGGKKLASFVTGGAKGFIEKGFSYVFTALQGIAGGVGATVSGLLGLGKGLLGTGFSLAKGIVKTGIKIAAPVVKTMGRLVGSALGITKEDIVGKRFVDIYIKDKIDLGNPILSARKQRDGVVFLDGSPVKRSSSISKPVMDPDNGDILITEDDIRNILVDKDNNPIYAKAGVLDSIGGLAGGLLKLPFKLLKGAGSLGKRVLGKTLDMGKGVLDWILGKEKSDKSYSGIAKRDLIAHVETPLMKIYSFLYENMPLRHEEIRGGSYEDYFSKKGDGGGIVSDVTSGVGSAAKNKLDLAKQILGLKKADGSDTMTGAVTGVIAAKLIGPIKAGLGTAYGLFKKTVFGMLTAVGAGFISLWNWIKMQVALTGGMTGGAGGKAKRGRARGRGIKGKLLGGALALGGAGYLLSKSSADASGMPSSDLGEFGSFDDSYDGEEAQQPSTTDRVLDTASGGMNMAYDGMLIGGVAGAVGKTKTGASVIDKILRLFQKVVTKLPVKFQKFLTVAMAKRMLAKIGLKALPKVLLRLSGPIGWAIVGGMVAVNAVQSFRHADEIMGLPIGTLSLLDKLKVGAAGAASEIVIGIISPATIAGWMGVKKTISKDEKLPEDFSKEDKEFEQSVRSSEQELMEASTATTTDIMKKALGYTPFGIAWMFQKKIASATSGTLYRQATSIKDLFVKYNKTMISTIGKGLGFVKDQVVSFYATMWDGLSGAVGKASELYESVAGSEYAGITGGDTSFGGRAFGGSGGIAHTGAGGGSSSTIGSKPSNRSETKYVNDKPGSGLKPLKASRYTPSSSTSTNFSNMKDIIKRAAMATGVDVKTLIAMAHIESKFNPLAHNKGSNAKGLFQILPGTWAEQYAMFGKKYNLVNDPFDPYSNTVIAAQYMKFGRNMLKNNGINNYGPSEAYVQHLLGPTGGKNFLLAYYQKPDDSVLLHVNKRAMDSNPSFFKTKSGTYVTMAEAYRNITSHIDASADFQDGVEKHTQENNILGVGISQDKGGGLGGAPLFKDSYDQREIVEHAKNTQPSIGLSGREQHGSNETQGGEISRQNSYAPVEDVSGLTGVDPAEADSYITWGGSADKSGLKPGFLSRLIAAAKSFFEKTGQKVVITSAFRSPEYQKKLRAAWERGSQILGRNARWRTTSMGNLNKPGNTSRHSSGIAVDIKNWRDFSPFAKTFGLSNTVVPNDEVHFEASRGFSGQGDGRDISQAINVAGQAESDASDSQVYDPNVDPNSESDTSFHTPMISGSARQPQVAFNKDTSMYGDSMSMSTSPDLNISRGMNHMADTFSTGVATAASATRGAGDIDSNNYLRIVADKVTIIADALLQKDLFGNITGLVENISKKGLFDLSQLGKDLKNIGSSSTELKNVTIAEGRKLGESTPSVSMSRKY